MLNYAGKDHGQEDLSSAIHEKRHEFGLCAHACPFSIEVNPLPQELVNMQTSASEGQTANLALRFG